MQDDWPSVFVECIIQPSNNVLHELKIIIDITTETPLQTSRNQRAAMRCDPESNKMIVCMF